MNNVLESFIKVNDDLVALLNPVNSFSAYYLRDEQKVELKVDRIDQNSNEFYISSSDDNFNLSSNNLCIKGCINIDNIKKLYGVDDDSNRIALDDTVIGVSINAYSLVSKNNFSIPIGELSSCDEYSSIQYTVSFPVGSIADKLFVSINLYVKKVKTTSSIYASIEGTVLGTIYNMVINLEGDGSLFPIRVISSTDEPLWYIDMNYDDLNDTFCKNNICLIINSKHSDFEKIGSEDITPDNKAIWKELLSSFFTQIIMGLNESEKQELFKDDIYADGSIGQFIKYLIDSFNIDKPVLDNPALLGKKILLGLDSIMK